MFKVDASDLAGITDELIDSIDPAIRRGAEMGSRSVISNSPVLTGLFKGNWRVFNNDNNDGSYSTVDPSGASTLAAMISKINSFSLRKDKMLVIQNNVLNTEDNRQYYAEFVGYDFSKSTALNIIKSAVVSVEFIR